MLSDGNINFNDYYTVAFRDGDIKLQGNYSHALVKSLREDYELKFEVDDNGFLNTSFTFEGVAVEITLT